MKISVCMGLYNGEPYIEEQLKSILEQTRKPDEVILVDDGSCDKTPEKVEEFLELHDLKGTWKLYRNEENRGYPANFYYACSLCSEDVVFLADQDDVWHPEKLEKMAAVLEQNPEVKCVSCKFDLLDSEGDQIHSIMNPTRTYGTEGLKPITPEGVFYKCEWPGMTLAYRNSWFQEKVAELGEKRGWRKVPHDFLICAKAAEEKGFVQMDACLAYHRRHDNNAGGEEHRLGKLLNKGRKLKEIREYLRILSCFKEGEVMNTPEGKKALEDKVLSMQDRLLALESRKFGEVLRNAGKHRGEVRAATLICDLIIVKKENPDV